MKMTKIDRICQFMAQNLDQYYCKLHNFFIFNDMDFGTFIAIEFIPVLAFRDEI